MPNLLKAGILYLVDRQHFQSDVGMVALLGRLSLHRLAALEYRDKNASPETQLRRLRMIRHVVDNRCPIIANDSPHVARAAGVSGVHLGQDDLPLHEARSLFPSAIFGLSVHSHAEMDEAVEMNASYVGCGSVFSTTTKIISQPPILPHGFRQCCAWADGRIPVWAIGGISRRTMAGLYGCGASGWVIGHGISCEGDPEASLTRAVEAFESQYE